MNDYSKTNACPKCESSNVHKRTTKEPKWRCNACWHCFDEIYRRPKRRSPRQEPIETDVEQKTCPVCGESYIGTLPEHLRADCSKSQSSQDDKAEPNQFR